MSNLKEALLAVAEELHERYYYYEATPITDTEVYSIVSSAFRDVANRLDEDRPYTDVNGVKIRA
jgi:hypothetical protein